MDQLAAAAERALRPVWRHAAWAVLSLCGVQLQRACARLPSKRPPRGLDAASAAAATGERSGALAAVARGGAGGVAASTTTVAGRAGDGVVTETSGSSGSENESESRSGSRADNRGGGRVGTPEPSHGAGIDEWLAAGERPYEHPARRRRSQGTVGSHGTGAGARGVRMSADSLDGSLASASHGGAGTAAGAPSS